MIYASVGMLATSKHTQVPLSREDVNNAKWASFRWADNK